MLEKSGTDLAILKKTFNRMLPGERITEGSSIFQGYSIEINNVEEVNRAYEAIKCALPKERHIVGVYRLPGHFLTNCEGCDDGEHGAARIIMNALKHANITHRALFITRWYDSTHIGVKRFESYLKAARSAIAHSPFNYLTKAAQSPWSEEYCLFQKDSDDDRSSRGQGKRSKGHWRGRGGKRANRDDNRQTQTQRKQMWSDDGANEIEGHFDEDGFPVNLLEAEPPDTGAEVNDNQ